MMSNRPSIRSTILLALIPLALLSGCGTNVHIFHPEPELLQPIPFVAVTSTGNSPPNRFELAAIVVNGTSSNYPANYFALRLNAYYSTTQQHSCHKMRDVDVYVPLTPGQSFELDHVEFDDPDYQNPAPCDCVKDHCQGLLWVTLIRQDTNQQVEGEKTKFGISWVSSGNLDDADSWDMIN